MPRYIDANEIDYTLTKVGIDENAGYRAVAFESDIDAMPTADVVEVKHGEWEHVHSIKHVDVQNVPVVQCSECKISFCDLINNHDVMYHYCPSCGARMMGGDPL